MTEPLLFPLFLKLDRRKVLVVGAGNVAASKIATLRGTGAQITVVAPATCAAIEEALERGEIELQRRSFEAADLQDAWLVIAAAPGPVNREVEAAAADRCVFVNAVDDPARSSAYSGGVTRRGGVTVAVSTGGRAPALAGLLRESIDALLPADIGSWVAEAAALRAGQKAAEVPIAARRPRLLEALLRRYPGSVP